MKIAVVDDEENFRVQLREYIARFSREEHIACEVRTFENGGQLVMEPHLDFDLIFLDVEMPVMDGMETARRIRQNDQRVGIIFITNMAQYAIRGWEFNAIDYIVKPVEYFTFAYKLRKALPFCNYRKDNALVVETDGSVIRVITRDIWYLEKDHNYLLVHTTQGEVRVRGTIAGVREQLEDVGFVVLNSGCMANVQYVEKLEKDVAIVHGIPLPVSRGKYKAIVNAMMDYWGGTKAL